MNGKNHLQRVALAGAFLAVLSAGSVAMAQTDITGVISALDGYREAAVAVGIAILLFVLGRTVVRKIAK